MTQKFNQKFASKIEAAFFLRFPNGYFSVILRHKFLKVTCGLVGGSTDKLALEQYADPLKLDINIEVETILDKTFGFFKSIENRVRVKPSPAMNWLKYEDQYFYLQPESSSEESFIIAFDKLFEEIATFILENKENLYNDQLKLKYLKINPQLKQQKNESNKQLQGDTTQRLNDPL